MRAKLAAKPDGDTIRAVLGDMADVAVEGPFDLVYVVYNTFFGLLTQEAQLACLTRAAARLAPAGKLVIEVFVPDVARFIDGLHDVVRQRIDTNLVYFAQGSPSTSCPSGCVTRRSPSSTSWRWAGWKKEPFGAGSPKHVSVYRLSG